MLITAGRLRDRDGLWDIEVTGGVITSITPARDAAAREPAGSGHRWAEGGDVVDAAGRLVVPQFVENHLHLDYANTAGRPRENASGTLFEGIEIWAERKAAGLDRVEEVRANALAAARQAVSRGVGFIRSHVDVTDPDLTALTALRELREEIRDWCHLQLVAFPQNGMVAYPGGTELVERALREGADVVGGIPHLEPTREDGVAALRQVFDLAERFDVLVDVHCDEIDDPHSRFVEVMAAETERRSLQGRVTVSHAVAMGYYGPGYLSRLLPKLAAAQLGFAVNPNENLHLQGRGFGAPTPRGVAPVRTLTEWGLPVAFGQDSMADPWYPLGAGTCSGSWSRDCTSRTCSRRSTSTAPWTSSPSTRRATSGSRTTGSPRGARRACSSSTHPTTAPRCVSGPRCSSVSTVAARSSAAARRRPPGRCDGRRGRGRRQRARRSRVRTVASAACAASAPLSSRDPGSPARSRACASSSVVSTPNPTGTPVRTVTSVSPTVAAWQT